MPAAPCLGTASEHGKGAGTRPAGTQPAGRTGRSGQRGVARAQQCETLCKAHGESGQGWESCRGKRVECPAPGSTHGCHQQGRHSIAGSTGTGVSFRGLLKHPWFLGLAAPTCPGLGAPQTAPASWDPGKDRRKPESNPGGFATPTAGENQLGQGDFQWECLEFPNPLTPPAGLTGSCVPGAGSPGAARGGGQRRFPC